MKGDKSNNDTETRETTARSNIFIYFSNIELYGMILSTKLKPNQTEER